MPDVQLRAGLHDVRIAVTMSALSTTHKLGIVNLNL